VRIKSYVKWWAITEKYNWMKMVKMRSLMWCGASIYIWEKIWGWQFGNRLMINETSCKILWQSLPLIEHQWLITTIEEWVERQHKTVWKLWIKSTRGGKDYWEWIRTWPDDFTNTFTIAKNRYISIDGLMKAVFAPPFFIK